jgi:hypothetical protein
MASPRITITLYPAQHEALERAIEAVNKNRQEPVKLSQVVRHALVKFLDEYNKNPREVAKQLELPFAKGGETGEEAAT